MLFSPGTSFKFRHRNAYRIAPSNPAPTTSQAEFKRGKRNSSAALQIASAKVGQSTMAERANCQVTTAISASDATLTPSSARTGRARGADFGDERRTDRDQHKRRQEYANRGGDRARGPVQEIAEKGGGGKHRAGRHLAHGDGVQQLLLREPGMPLDQLGAQKHQQHVAAAEHHRADLGEAQEDRPQPRRDCGSGGRRRRYRVSR